MNFVTGLEDQILSVRFQGAVGTGKSLPQICREMTACVESFLHDGGSLVLLDFSQADFANAPFYDPLVYAMSRHFVAERRVAVCLGANPGISYVGALMYFPCFDEEAEARGFLCADSPDQYLAQRDHRLWAQLGPEEGPERCKRECCKNLRIRLSVLCKYHHYEMIKGENYVGKGGVQPFEGDDGAVGK